MARIFKQTYTKPLPVGAEVLTRKGKRYARYKDRSGRTLTAQLSQNGKRIVVQTKKWHIDYRDADGVKKRVKGFTDKRATEQLACELERKTELEQIGIVDRYEQHNKRSLGEHLADFRAALLNKGNTKQHAILTAQRAGAIVETCGFTFVRDISAHKVSTYLKDRREAGLSIESSNHYLRAIKSFLNWMVKDSRMPENPLKHLSLMNSKVDRRHQRRALSSEEWERLIEATHKGPKHHGLDGETRAIVYILAAYTGLRAKELRSLKWKSFDFDEKHPTVTVTAAYSKRRREDVLPLRPDIAKMLREWKSTLSVGDNEQVFKIPQKPADMLKPDLKAAGIPYKDAQGRVADFHSLRHTFITNLVKGGVSPRVAQALARHSTITLTMDRYTHMNLVDQTAGLKALPDLPGTRDKQNGNEAVVLKTGTDEMPVSKSDAKSCRNLVEIPSTEGLRRSSNGTGGGDKKRESKGVSSSDNSLNKPYLDNGKHLVSLDDSAPKKTRPTGFEPVTYGLEIR